MQGAGTYHYTLSREGDEENGKQEGDEVVEVKIGGQKLGNGWRLREWLNLNVRYRFFIFLFFLYYSALFFTYNTCSYHTLYTVFLQFLLHNRSHTWCPRNKCTYCFNFIYCIIPIRGFNFIWLWRKYRAHTVTNTLLLQYEFVCFNSSPQSLYCSHQSFHKKHKLLSL